MEVTRQTLAKILAGVFVFNLLVMGAGAWYAYQAAPPIPQKIVGPDGATVATQADIQAGKVAFQKNGLMNHGSILGNGAYFGVDYTADALDSTVQYMRSYYAEHRYGKPYDALSAERQASIAASVKADLNRDAPSDGVIHYTAAEVYAHEQVQQDYVERYYDGEPERGTPAGMIRSPESARHFADFALWTAWAAHTDRPGSSHSYTNDWPFVPGAGNRPTGSAMLWSVVAMVLLVAGAGAGVWLYRAIDLPEPDAEELSVSDPEDFELFPSQRTAVKFVPVAALLFVVQVLLGGLLAHYYIERAGFFGITSLFGVNLISVLPFSMAKTWHIDLAILWIATLWIGAGLVLPGLLTRSEPRNQQTYVRILLGALLVVAVGGLAGIWLGAQGYIDGALWWLFGNEGLEYLEVGKVWQAGLLVGFVLWTVLVARGFKPLLEREHRYGLAHMIIYAGGSIGLLFGAGFMFTPKTNIAVTEFWRWWVVHMWVEGAFEFFIVAIVAVVLVSMNLLARRSAEKAVLVEALLVMGAGIIGVSHHYWWIGMPDVWVPLGSVFSTLELIPLVFILYEALNEYRTLRATGESFPYRLPFMFMIASGAWNFVGAGVLGFFINLPLLNYYEHGTYLTVAHAHAAMFGAFGFLALGMAIFMLRISTEHWDGRLLHWAFWSWNIGLAVMVLISLLPVGFIQLEVAFTQGYDAARSLAFYNRPLIQWLFWARLPGDTLVIVGSVLFAYDVGKKLLDQRASDDPADLPDHVPVPDRVYSDDD
ncbi:MAG: nitric-oxide reductase large subunit [Halanaeroarchaeum sp.]